ncbi:TetR/AcrR family transcriptional regulator [Streptomyces atratus]|uniref:TetR/AcrR family transcriptional regulator n=1 Tax=Streptomyces atratus TaxID=1893 RepID=UPI0036CB19E2
MHLSESFSGPACPANISNPDRPVWLTGRVCPRRCSHRRHAARARLLTAADELFCAEGVRSVRIDRVIAHAGAAKATLYNAFGTKDGLVRAYLQARHAATAEHMTRWRRACAAVWRTVGRCGTGGDRPAGQLQQPRLLCQTLHRRRPRIRHRCIAAQWLAPEFRRGLTPEPVLHLSTSQAM